MIRITKGNAPGVLGTAGPGLVTAHQTAVNEDPAAYASGAKKLSFSKATYGHEDVVEELRKAQHGKCCYCEVLIETPYMDEHVEHWRPKGSIKQLHGTPEHRPGYYWLAYTWDNLFLSCQVCNRNHKGSQFPLANSVSRARNPHQQPGLADEQPLLLKPDGALNPETEIIWVEDVPKGTSVHGEMTIKVCGLTRDLDPRRGSTLTRLRQALERLRKHYTDPSPAVQELMDEHRATLRRASHPSAPHSAMAKAFLAANAPWQHL